MKDKLFIAGILAGLCFASCTVTELDQPEPAEGAEGAVTEVICSIDDYQFEETKADISATGSFTWSTDDKMAMWPSSSAVYSGTPQACIFKVREGGSKTASLVGNGWGLLRGQQYFAAFPYSSSDTYSKVTIQYSGMNQLANNSTSHLGRYDYQHAVTTVPAVGNATINFERISSIVKFVITVPENRANVKYTKLSLSCEDNIFSNSATYNPSANEVVLSSSKVSQISMNLNGTTGFTPTDGVLTLFVIMAPADWAGKNIELSLTDEYNYSYSGSFTPSKNQSHGSAGTLPLSVELQKGISLPYELVDMGLSVLWTTANYGANTPSQFGTYLDGEDDICDKDLIDEINSQYGNKVSYQIPTRQQFDELIKNCTITTTTLDGVTVQKFTSKKNNAVLYLPAAGYITYYSTRREVGIGTEFAYWTSTNRFTYDPYYYNGVDANHYMEDVDDDYVSMPVRLIWSGESYATDVLTGLTISPESVTIEEGITTTLTATVTPLDAMDKSVTWSSSDMNIATVDENGTVTGVSVGTATITCRTVNGGYTANCTVNVIAGTPVTGVKITTAAITGKNNIGQGYQLIASVLPSNATRKDVTWSSSNTKVATVGQDGIFRTIGVGSAVITVTTEDGGYQATYNVDVDGALSYEYVDLGLSVKWATCNLGTTSPYEVNDNKCAWGENYAKTYYPKTLPYYYYYDPELGYTKYTYEGLNILQPEDDPATYLLGPDWRMPSTSEWNELLTECTWEFVTVNPNSPIQGYKVTSRVAGYTDKSIFLSMNGYSDKDGTVYVGYRGDYWSSNYGSVLALRETSYSMGSRSIFNGASVRPVTTAEKLENTPLTFKSSGNTIISMGDYTDDGNYEAEYSLNGSGWTTYTMSSTISLKDGDTIAFRKHANGFSLSPEDHYRFITGGTGTLSVYGNVMSLLDPTMQLLEVSRGGQFPYLFRNCTNITDASALVLPATKLSAACYWGMFEGCTNLRSAPQLPATALETNCYANMFKGCSSLISAPRLPARTLVGTCYNSMFYGCSALKYIEVLFTTYQSTNLTNWMYGVSSTGLFIRSEDATWSTSGDSVIPSGWRLGTINK